MIVEWASIYMMYDASIKLFERAWTWHVEQVSNHLMDTESGFAPWDLSKAHILVSTPEKRPWNDNAEGTPYDIYQAAHPHLFCLASFQWFQCYLSRHGRDHTRTRLTQTPGQVGILKVWTPISHRKNYGNESADVKTCQQTLYLIFISSYLMWSLLISWLGTKGEGAEPQLDTDTALAPFKDC